MKTAKFSISDCALDVRSWSPNDGYYPDGSSDGTNNLYTLFFPFQNIGDQLDSEIMPLRVQWAAEEGKSELDPNSESWARFKRLYGYQFGEQKTIGLYAPELSFEGAGSRTVDNYNFGRYLRIVYLYVKPEATGEFEGFVHKYIVPAAEKILAQRDLATNAPPPEQRTYWRFPGMVRKVSINVNMPTLPEFELFIQQNLLRAARDTNVPVLTYRTVTGDKHNYHLIFPFNHEVEIQHDRKLLMASALMREHQLQLLAMKKGKNAELALAAYRKDPAALADTYAAGDSLAADFHSHAIDIEEIVYHARPDMSALLTGRYSKESVDRVWQQYQRRSTTT